MNTQAIKGYELRERIGSGGFGVVYRAYQTTVGREVAIKIILPHFANHPDFIRRFEIEAQLVARLEHLHIVPLYDFWRDPEGAYLVMRWLRGGSLRGALENGAYDLRAAARLIDQIASALALAHRSNIVHRDLKPANILLDEEGNAYLTDFGIAQDSRKTGGSRLTAEVARGSPDYLSPEQARGDPVTAQSDIYSLGVLLYELLTGQHPFPNCTPIERMYKHLNEPLPRIEELPAELLNQVNTIIQKATAKNPAQRYEDVATLAAEFHQMAASDDAPAGNRLVEQLTFREQEILRLIIDGCTNGEIAQQLFVTVGTVKWYIRQIYQKLHVRSRVQAIVRARELRLIVADTDGVSAISAPAAVPPLEPENPYKGLRAFQTADARDFFGRTNSIQKLVYRLAEKERLARFLAVVGPSGSGKSSMVLAGLIPALWRGEVPGSEHWFIVQMAPGAHPLDELEIALTRIAADTVSDLRGHLERDQRGLVRAASLILPDDGSELLVIVDQLEEVFTLVEDEAARVQFLNLLYSAVTDPRSRVRVVVTLRADFYDRPLHYPEFGELVRLRMETVLPLSANELEEAITKPAERVGVSFEPGLVANIISESHYQPGALPLLQYALAELFEQRDGQLLTCHAYHALGGVVGALAKQADELYLEQTTSGRNAVRQMFLRLVTFSDEGEDSRRRVPRSELLGVTAEPDLMDEIMDTFAAYRLITLDHAPATRSPTVELAHEAILRQWLRLRGWLDASRDDIRQQRLLAAAAEDWFRAGQDASYLLRGARLEQFADWSARTQIALTARERSFLETALARRTSEEETERERHAHELALARQAETSQRRAAKRLRYLVAGLLLFLLVTAVLSIFALGKRDEAEQARATSVAQALLAQEQAIQSQELALVNGAQAALAQDSLDLALALAVTANRTSHPSAQAQRVLSEAAYRPGPIRHYSGLGSPAMSVAFTPDGSRILAGGIDKLAYIWETATGKLLHRLEGHQDWIVDVGISSDGRTGFTLSRDRTIIVWDLISGEPIRRFGSDLILGPEALSAVFSPDGRYILSNNGGRPQSRPGEEAYLILWDVTTGQPVRFFRGHTTGVGAVAISADGSRVLSGGLMGNMILWDMETGTMLQHFSENTPDWRQLPSDLTFSPDGKTAYSLGMDGVVTVWNLETLKAVYHLGNPYPQENWSWSQIALSRDGRMVSAHLVEGGLGLWDTETGKLINKLPAAGNPVAFNPHNREVLSGDWPDMRLWDLSNGAELQHFETRLPVFPAAGLAVSPDGMRLLAVTSAGMGAAGGCDFVIFDVPAGQALRHIMMDADEVDELGCVLWAVPVFSRDGSIILTGVDERVILWEVDTGKRLRTFSGHSAAVSSIAISPDGNTVMSGDISGELILWDFETAQPVRRFAGHTSVIVSIVFHPTQPTALSGSSPDGSVILWDVLTGKRQRIFEGAQGGVYSVGLSPNGQYLFASDESGKITIWDYASSQIVQRFQSPFGAGRAVFTPDGSGILLDGSTLWDVRSGEAIRRYPSGKQVALHPDGRSFFAVNPSQTTTIIQWRIDTLDELAAWTLTHRMVRELNCEERRLYQLEAMCDATGVSPTRTPYPVMFLTPASTAVQVTNPHAISASLATPTLTVTPYPALTARLGDNRGEVRVGDAQVWQYNGIAGETLDIYVKADRPANETRQGNTAAPEANGLDTLVIVTAPDGRDLNVYNSGGGLMYQPAQSDDIEAGTNTDSRVEGLVLPIDGIYQIIVSGSGYRTGGAYTLTLESR